MFLYRKDVSQILREIKNHIPLFEKEKVLEYTKWVIPRVYESIKYSDIKKIKNLCNEKTITKLTNFKEKYRINDDIDRVLVQYSSLHDFIYKSEDEMYIQVYNSVYLHDNILNNGPLTEKELLKVMSRTAEYKYWNDIWIVTYGKKKSLVNIKSANCSNCGAIMKYDEEKNMLICEHCQNISFGNLEDTDEWEIVDIEKI